MGEVGTSKVHEDDRIIVWEFTLEPGERTPCHTHHHDYIFYVLQGSKLETFDAEEKSLFTFEPQAGDVFSLRCDGADLVSNDDRGYRVPATHSARNIGSGRYREVLIEKKA